LEVLDENKPKVEKSLLKEKYILTWYIYSI